MRARLARAGLRATGATLVLTGALLTSLSLASAPAMALSQRGHAFSLSFGEAGKGPSQFEQPSGIAVEDSTGDFYVADRRNNRVLEFKPKLTAEGEVAEPEQIRELKVPDPLYVAVDNSTSSSDLSKGDVYVVGAKQSEKNEPEPEGFIVYKFGGGSGELLTKLTKFKLKATGEEEEFEGIKGVAVNSAGSVYVDQEKKVFEFNDDEKNKAVRAMESHAGEASPGLAVDADGDLYLGIHEVEAAGASEAEVEITEQIELEDERDGLILPEQFEVVAEINGANGRVEDPELDPEYSPAVAVNQGVVAKDPEEQKEIEKELGVDERNDVYVANVTSIGGQASTTIAQFNEEHELIQRFSASGLRLGDGIGVDPQTGIVYVADAQADEVDIFQLERPGPPTVGGLTACALEGGPHCPTTPGVTTLKAQVDPEGAETTYRFEYGPESCSASECKATPEEQAGNGFVSEEVSYELPELAAGVWHYRIVATNKGKEGEVRTARSAEQTFTVLSSTSGLPDHRQWELVSQAKNEREGSQPEPMPASGGAIQAAEDGDAISYVTNGPMGSEPAGSRSPEQTQILSTIGAHEWSSEDLTTPNNAATGLHTGLPQEYQIFSSDLALALLQPYPGGENTGALAEPPLSPPLKWKENGEVHTEEKQEKTIYLRRDAPEKLLSPMASEAEREDYEKAKANGEKMGNPGYLALVTELNAPAGEPFGGPYNVTYEGVALTGVATPDLSHVLFESHRTAPGIYEWGPAGSCSIKENPLCTGGEVQAVSVLPNGTLVPPSPATVHATVGAGEGRDVRHAISDDGDLVIWTEQTPAANHLYVRDTVTEETLQLDAVEGGSGAGPANAEFDTANADGSKVFFTDTQRLTAGSGAAERLPDLYVAELSGGRAAGERLSFTLTDLTPHGIHGESADVQVSHQGVAQGGVLGASEEASEEEVGEEEEAGEEGSYVYFVANGALTAEATRGRCPENEEPVSAAITCNLYVSHYEKGTWETKLIAALSARDSPDWGDGGKSGNLTYMTSRVSPDGKYLAFMSERSLTGYDNEDVTSRTPGETLDEEVYLYDAGDGHLVCVSCDPSGERPAGVYDAGFPEPTLAVDESEVWAAREKVKLDDHWLAGSIPGWTPIQEGLKALYQPRYLSNSGRLFFDSPENLVPAAESDVEKVYEYEPNSVGSCELVGGCVGLISSGSSEQESAFLDASANGDDVFFFTAAHLVQQDTSEGFAVYDARVCEPASRCLPPPAGTARECESEEKCQRGYTPQPGSEAPASTMSSASGSVSAQHEVLSEKVVSPPSSPPKKTLTQAQKLANALKACRTKYKHSKSKRLACEKRARKSYGPKAKKSSRRRSAR